MSDTKVCCNACLKIYSNKYNLERHIISSKSCSTIRELMKANEDYKNQIDILANKLKVFTDREEELLRKREVTKSKKKTQSSLIPIKDEDILNASKRITQRILDDRAEGLANWMLSFLKDSVICVDQSRKKIVWKDEDDISIINDNIGKYLLVKVFNDDVKNVINTILKKEQAHHTKIVNSGDRYAFEESTQILQQNSRKQCNINGITELTKFSKKVINLFITGIKRFNLKDKDE